MKCDYRNVECTNKGKVIDGKWWCSNHTECRKSRADQFRDRLEKMFVFGKPDIDQIMDAYNEIHK